MIKQLGVCKYCKRKLLLPAWTICEDKRCKYLRDKKQREKIKNCRDFGARTDKKLVNYLKKQGYSSLGKLLDKK